MKKKLLSLLLLVCVSLGTFVGCLEGDTAASTSTDSNSSATVNKIDYAGQLKLDKNSNSEKITLNTKDSQGRVTYTHIDGDTTHFNVSYDIDQNGKIKCRYLGVDTPESTGDIEVWGKKASAFTKEKLASATSVVLESDGDHWTYDTNGRYLTWVWYLTAGASEYRLLNLELLQEGLAVESDTANSRYGDECAVAADQARTIGLYLYSDDTDPDFYYGDAVTTTLKAVRSNLDDYVGKRVAVHGIVSVYAGKGSIYVQEYDEEDGRSYGLPIFYGYNNVSYDPILAPGNEVRIVGEVTYSETFGYQISGLFYDFMDPDNKESIKCFSKNNLVEFPEITVADYIANDYALAKDLLYGTVSVKNLKVVDVYTTKDGDSKGAMTLTCEDADGKQIDVRTTVMKKDGAIITADAYLNKTIDVKGVAEVYEYTDTQTNERVSEYQINVFSSASIIVH